jgi:hypothetical protein
MADAKWDVIGEYSKFAGLSSAVMQQFENSKIRVQKKTEAVARSITSHEELMREMKEFSAELSSKGN